MHGRKRVIPTAEQTAAVAKKADTLRKLTNLALKHRAALSSEADASKLNTELLALNPDLYSLWSYRRELLLKKLEGPDAAAEALRPLVAEELKISQAGIARNPKSYPAWAHRTWVIKRYPLVVDFSKEVALCNQLLDADERNFHCWNYRRWVVGVAAAHNAVSGCATGVSSSVCSPKVDASSSGIASAGAGPFSAASELAYSRERIRRNFSNYSAWHHRSVLLLQLQADSAGAGSSGCSSASLLEARRAAGKQAQPLALALAAPELALVRRALFTEPDDQSAWFYHRWLVDRLRDAADAAGAAVACAPPAASAVHMAACLLQDAGALAELAAAEASSKWPQLGLAHTLQALSCSVQLRAAAHALRSGTVEAAVEAIANAAAALSLAEASDVGSGSGSAAAGGAGPAESAVSSSTPASAPVSAADSASVASIADAIAAGLAVLLPPEDAEAEGKAAAASDALSGDVEIKTGESVPAAAAASPAALVGCERSSRRDALAPLPCVARAYAAAAAVDPVHAACYAALARAAV